MKAQRVLSRVGIFYPLDFRFLFAYACFLQSAAGKGVVRAVASLALPAKPPQSSARPWVLPMRGLATFYGCPRIHRLSHYFLPRVLVRDKRVLYLDGANHFDPLLLARLARQRGHDPAEFNRNIRVARAFTCFQLTELLSRTPRWLRSFPADVVIVSALPELYLDEDARESDALASFHKALGQLERLASQIPVAVFSDAPSWATSQRKFWQQLIARADHVWKFTVQEDNTLAITSEKIPASLPCRIGG